MIIELVYIRYIAKEQKIYMKVSKFEISNKNCLDEDKNE